MIDNNLLKQHRSTILFLWDDLVKRWDRHMFPSDSYWNLERSWRIITELNSPHRVAEGK